MSEIVLVQRNAPSVPLDAPGLRPDRFAELSEAEIAHLPVWHGNEEASIGDFFDVRGGHSDQVRLLGDFRRVKEIGAGMASGRLAVEGSVGAHTGARMAGGHLRVDGDAGDHAGSEMSGGTLEIRGNAGDHLAGAYPGSIRGMRGGVVLVHGSAGWGAAERMRRGLIAVAGDAGEGAGLSMIAGSLFVFGTLARRAGAGMKRGTLLSGGEPDLLPTFRLATTYRPDWLAVYLRRLRIQYQFAVADRFLSGVYRRFTGDFTELGKGEILVWTDA